MNQYVRWFAQQRAMPLGKVSSGPQRIIAGAGGRSYQFVVADTLTHDHFYTEPTIRQWYETYVSTILYRVNTINGFSYKDDPTILAWELANEPRSSDPTGGIVNEWMDEMSTFLKSIDTNHLVSTGEEGLEVSDEAFASSADYNNQSWLFNGTGGTSFEKNTSLPNIDVASIHCYPSAWNLTLNQSIRWLRDHQEVADRLEKPLILGEIGTRQSRRILYDAIFNEGYYCDVAGVLLWQFVYDGRPNNDGYAFSYPADGSICTVLESGAERFATRLDNSTTAADVLQNYPNPFNAITIVTYSVTVPSRVRLDAFNTLGQRLEILVDDELSPGTHVALFDGTMYGSGVYFLRLSSSQGVKTRSISLIK
jgi:endo-1,4-beta-mannosidase